MNGVGVIPGAGVVLADLVDFFGAINGLGGAYLVVTVSSRRVSAGGNVIS